MTLPLLIPIVEGQGKIEAVPALLHRIAGHLGRAVRVGQPIRIKSGSFLDDAAYFRKYLALATAKAAQGQGSVLILLDCEDDCPARLGPKLLARAQAIRADIPLLVALAYREFETWFLAGAASLQGVEGLPADLTPPTQPERIRDAKGWLGERMPNRYDPIIHQHRLARAVDLGQARTNGSFDRFYRRLSGILMPEPMANDG